MSGLQRVTDLLRQAVTTLETTASSNNTDNSSQSYIPNSSTELRRIFAPYRRCQKTSVQHSIIPKTTWTHTFCCLAIPEQETVPDKSLKKVLMDAGLGEKRLQLSKNKDPKYFRTEILTTYPKLKEGGGFELLRSNSRVSLEKLSVPASGYTSQYLADESGLGAAICYVRPIQDSLSLDPVKEIVGSWLVQFIQSSGRG